MSEVENKPVVVPATEAAPAEETTAITETKIAIDSVKLKKVDKKSLLTKLKAIIKKVLPSKKEKAPAVTEESEPEAAPTVEPAVAPATTAAA